MKRTVRHSDCTSVILALRGLRQEDYELESSLGYYSKSLTHRTDRQTTHTHTYNNATNISDHRFKNYSDRLGFVLRYSHEGTEVMSAHVFTPSLHFSRIFLNVLLLHDFVSGAWPAAGGGS